MDNMWRAGVVIFMLVLAESSADVQYGKAPTQSVERVRRSPHYYDDCPPPYYHRHHHPPPFWPPPPPPRPYWPPPPPPPPQKEEMYFPQEQNKQAYTKPEEKPCCGKGSDSNAVSNAKSDTGDAVAIAIARSKANK